MQFNRASPSTRRQVRPGRPTQTLQLVMEADQAGPLLAIRLAAEGNSHPTMADSRCRRHPARGAEARHERGRKRADGSRRQGGMNGPCTCPCIDWAASTVAKNDAVSDRLDNLNF